MTRLSDRAYQLLASEVRRLAGDDPLQQPQRDLVLKQLARLKDQPGEPVTRDAMQGIVQDFFPNFSPAVLDQAARANRPPNGVAQGIQGLGIVAATIGGLAGLVWFVNLPYPMIRRPVARVFPMVLLPSFMSMDQHYRQTISLVEQADQLINQATGPADIALGKQKTTGAQASLDRLPVWFLGYYPQRYCHWASCSWQFTLDEYKQARAQVGRMEAKVFQEEQALEQLKVAETSLGAAQALFAAIPDKQEAVAQWRAALDQLEQVPDNTLAGRLAAGKWAAYSREFEGVAGTVAGETRTGLRVDVAQEYAQQAIATAQNPPHSIFVWRKAAGQWKDAIAQLAEVPPEDPGYRTAQQRLAQYKSSLGDVEIRLAQEEAAQTRLELAQQGYHRLLARSDSADYQRSQLQGILDQLQQIPPGTTAYATATPLRLSVQQQVQRLGSN